MKRFNLLSFSVILVSVIYIIRLFYLQVIDNTYNIPTLNNSAVKVVYDYPERGYIYDRNGILLVANQVSYDIMIVPNEVHKLDTIEFCNLLKISKEYLIKKTEKATKKKPQKQQEKELDTINKDNAVSFLEAISKYNFINPESSLVKTARGIGMSLGD